MLAVIPRFGARARRRQAPPFRRYSTPDNDLRHPRRRAAAVTVRSDPAERVSPCGRRFPDSETPNAVIWIYMSCPTVPVIDAAHPRRVTAMVTSKTPVTGHVPAPHQKEMRSLNGVRVGAKIEARCDRLGESGGDISCLDRPVSM